MTNTNTTPMDNSDPRFGFAHVTSVVRGLIEATTSDQLDNPTPCEDFTVKDLLDHFNLVMARVGVIGAGGHWSEVTNETVAMDNGHAAAFAAYAHEVQDAWTDDAKLGQTYEVPWGELPGAPILLTYTAELAAHGWDLATATGQAIEIADGVLAGALVAAKMIPAEGRGEQEMPFDAVVDPGTEASALIQIAGWLGRQVV